MTALFQVSLTQAGRGDGFFENATRPARLNPERPHARDYRWRHFVDPPGDTAS